MSLFGMILNKEIIEGDAIFLQNVTVFFHRNRPYFSNETDRIFLQKQTVFPEIEGSNIFPKKVTIFF